MLGLDWGVSSVYRSRCGRILWLYRSVPLNLSTIAIITRGKPHWFGFLCDIVWFDVKLLLDRVGNGGRRIVNIKTCRLIRSRNLQGALR